METKRLVQGRDNGGKTEFRHLDLWAGCSCHRKGSSRAKGRARTGLYRAELDPAATARGKGRERQRHRRPAALGAQLAQHGYQQCHPSCQQLSPSSGTGKADSEATDILLHPSSPRPPLFCHFAILPFCCILTRLVEYKYLLIKPFPPLLLS